MSSRIEIQNFLDDNYSDIIEKISDDDILEEMLQRKIRIPHYMFSNDLLVAECGRRGYHIFDSGSFERIRQLLLFKNPRGPIDEDQKLLFDFFDIK